MLRIDIFRDGEFGVANMPPWRTCDCGLSLAMKITSEAHVLMMRCDAMRCDALATVITSKKRMQDVADGKRKGLVVSGMLELGAPASAMVPTTYSVEGELEIHAQSAIWSMNLQVPKGSKLDERESLAKRETWRG